MNRVRLLKLNLPISEVLNVDAAIFVEVPFIFNFKLGSYLRDCLVGCGVTWGGKDSIVHIDDGD